VPSLYAQYLCERTNDFILEDDHGFATYRYLDDNKVYIIDIFVEKEFRKNGIATVIANKIAKQAKRDGRTLLIGSVQPSAKNSSESMKALLAYGMKIESSGQDFIILRKDI